MWSFGGRRGRSCRRLRRWLRSPLPSAASDTPTVDRRLVVGIGEGFLGSGVVGRGAAALGVYMELQQ